MLGRQFQQQNQTQKSEPNAGLTQPPADSKSVATMLGLMGSMATEMIISDLGTMIDKKMQAQLDGYVLALSRIMRHDIAWQCVVKAFSDKKMSIPEKYGPQFGNLPIQPKHGANPIFPPEAAVLTPHHAHGLPDPALGLVRAEDEAATEFFRGRGIEDGLPVSQA